MSEFEIWRDRVLVEVSPYIDELNRSHFSGPSWFFSDTKAVGLFGVLERVVEWRSNLLSRFISLSVAPIEHDDGSFSILAILAITSAELSENHDSNKNYFLFNHFLQMTLSREEAWRLTFYQLSDTPETFFKRYFNAVDQAFSGQLKPVLEGKAWIHVPLQYLGEK